MSLMIMLPDSCSQCPGLHLLLVSGAVRAAIAGFMKAKILSQNKHRNLNEWKSI